MEINSSEGARKGRMKWHAPGLNEGAKILHLKRSDHEPWLPYTSFPLLIPKEVRARDNHGFASAQYLLKAGWTYENANV